MKKLLAFACAGIMAFSLFACAPPSPTAPTAGAPTAGAPTDAGTPTDVAPTQGDQQPVSTDLNVGVFYYNFADTYISTVRSELDKLLTAEGIKFTNFDGENNQTKQDEQIDTAISQGANLLVVNVVTSGSTDVAAQIISKAQAKSIPVIFFNRAIGVENDEGPILSGYENSVFVGTDAPEAGHMQGQLIAETLLTDYAAYDLNGDGAISYAMFKGDEANMEAIARTKYGVEDADAGLTAAGKPALVYFDAANASKYQVDPNGAWSSEAAFSFMQTNLATYNEANGNMIELAICNNDGMAEGVVSALNDAGYNTGSGKSIPVFGVDATDAAKELIGAKKMAGTIKQDNVGMAEGIGHFVKNIKNGSALKAGIEGFNTDPAVPAKVYIPYAKYTG